MRLFISSYGLGNHPEQFAQLFGDNKKVALIMNATDQYPPEGRAERLPRHLASLSAIGLEPADLDLRNYFDNPGRLQLELSQFGGTWVIGGNTFVLRRAMQDSGFDEAIKRLLENDQIVYGGFSAGACVLAPTLRGIDLADEPERVYGTFGKEIVWEGLNLVPYMVVPHYKSDHPESAAMENVVQFLVAERLPFRVLADGDVIIVNGTTKNVLAPKESRAAATPAGGRGQRRSRATRRTR